MVLPRDTAPASASAPAGGRYRRNIMRLASGTVVSQAIVVGATPVLTRLYAPEDFGAAAVFSSLYAVLVCLATLKYDAAVILPKATRLAVHLTALTLVLTVLFVAAVGSGWWIAQQLGGTRWPGFLVALPLAVAAGAALTLAQQWCARRADYRHYAQAQVVGALANVGLSLALVLSWGRAPAYMVAGFVVSLWAALAFMLWAATGYGIPWVTRLAQAMRTPLVRTAMSWRQFPLVVLPTSLLTVAAASAQPILVQQWFDWHTTGQFAVASRFLLIPGAVIGAAVNEAFRAEFVARLRRSEPVLALARRTLTRLALVALPLLAIVVVAAPWLFAWVFGETYRVSGYYAQIMAAAVFGVFVVAPLQSVFVATGHAGQGLLAQVLMTVLPLTALAGAAQASGSLPVALGAHAVATVGGAVFTLGMAWRRCQRADAQLMSEIDRG